MRHQRLEHRRGLQRELDLPFAGPQAPGFDIEPIATEANALLHRTLPVLVDTTTIPEKSRRPPRTSCRCAHHSLCGRTTGEENTSWQPGRRIRASIPRPAWP